MNRDVRLAGSRDDDYYYLPQGKRPPELTNSAQWITAI
jgi:hypothetical protein